ALTLPVLLLLAALIVTLSLVGVARLATENAASEAARTLALTNDDARATATALAATAPLRPELVDVRIEPGSAALRPGGSPWRISTRPAPQKQPQKPPAASSRSVWSSFGPTRSRSTARPTSSMRRSTIRYLGRERRERRETFSCRSAEI